MVALLPSPELTFIDNNGIPYAAGTLATYQPGTSTPKATWNEPTGTTANANPLTLDSAGRCIVYGDGSYRFVLKDSGGNTIFDQPTSTVVSAAMAPVCLAVDLPTAKGLLGIVDNSAALATLTSGLAAANTAIAAETTRATAAEGTLTTNVAANATAITAERTRAMAAEAAIAAGLFKAGTGGPADGSGHYRVNYPAAFPTATTAFVVQGLAAGLLGDCGPTIQIDRFGADVWVMDIRSNPLVGFNFVWIAVGS